MHNYDRTAAVKLPASKVIKPIWSKLGDLDDDLSQALHAYDVTPSHSNEPGGKEAREIFDTILTCREMLQKLSGNRGVFQKLLKLETEFSKKF